MGPSPGLGPPARGAHFLARGEAAVDQFAVLIDAGHLLAEAGKLCCGTQKRGMLECDWEQLVEYVKGVAFADCGLPLLRVYWYDGAQDGIPTIDHLEVARLTMVKLRLGRMSGGKQKGVDALIYRDLMTLARERAICRAYLLGGDEDLREGVTSAQDMGVQVSVMGIPPVRGRNQSDTLLREADQVMVLEKDVLAGCRKILGIHV